MKKKSSKDKQKQEQDMMEKALNSALVRERMRQAYEYMRRQQAAMQGIITGNMSSGWDQGNYGGYPDWQHRYYQQQPVEQEAIPDLPAPGIEVQAIPGGDCYRVRLTINIDQQTLSDAKDRQLLIQVALQRAIQGATKKILGAIALERIKMQVNKEEEPDTGTMKA